MALEKKCSNLHRQLTLTQCSCGKAGIDVHKGLLMARKTVTRTSVLALEMGHFKPAAIALGSSPIIIARAVATVIKRHNFCRTWKRLGQRSVKSSRLVAMLALACQTPIRHRSAGRVLSAPERGNLVAIEQHAVAQLTCRAQIARRTPVCRRSLP